MKTSRPAPFALFLFIYTTHGANILLLSPMGSESHKIFFMGIVNKLAERDHEVTIVSAYKNSEIVKNVNDVVIPVRKVTQLLSNVFEEGAADQLLYDLIKQSPKICNEGLGTHEVQDLKRNKYDIVLYDTFFSHCYLSLIHHFKVPFIYMFTAGLNGPMNDMIGNIDVPSISGNKFLGTSFPLSFSERFITVVTNLWFPVFISYYMLPEIEWLCKENGLCPSDMPKFQTFDQNASFAIINVIRSLDHPPRPAVPNLIYAGGAHIRTAEPLSKELENWVLGSGDAGFIFFSLGSAVKPSDMPERYRNIFVNVFGTLKQRVLWKWDKEMMPNLPQNVKLEKWLPQQDILAHNKLRLFISHGGSLSTMEATYHGVPVLGLPIFADQFSNMREAASEGWAKVLHWKNLNETVLTAAINETLHDDSVREISKKRSFIMKDRLVHPADEAAYWIEYTLRHNGAEHLRSPVFKLSWYELYNVDVWGLIITLMWLVVCAFAFLIRTIFRQFCRTYRKPRKDETKKKSD